MQWRTQKVSSRSYDVTNQFEECGRHDHYRVVLRHAQKNFAKLHLKIRIFVPVKSEPLENQKNVRICFEIQGKPRILPKKQLCFC